MTVDWSISFSAILQMLTMVGCVVALIVSVSNKLQRFETVLKQHAETLNKHERTLGLYETRILEIVGNIQRVIGQLDTHSRRSTG